MAVSRLPNQGNITSAGIKELIPCQLDYEQATPTQIAEHLRCMLESLGMGQPPALKLPSTKELAEFYHRSIPEVLDALQTLKEQHYEYVMHGLDTPVILHDPLSRSRADARQAPKPHASPSKPCHPKD